MTSLKEVSVDELARRLGTAEKIIRASREISLEGFSMNPGFRAPRATSKSKTSFRDLVTEYDQKVEVFLTAELSKHYPHDTIIGEESSFSAGKKGAPAENGLLWVLDPIDGTTNYSRSFPHFCTTAALLFKDGDTTEILLGLTYDPVRDELFTATKGQGAYVSFQSQPKEKILVSPIQEMKQALLVTGFASERAAQFEAPFERFKNLTRETLGVRRLGAAALDLAYVAMGRLDAYWEYGLSSWDVAAGALLVREAGGKITHFERADDWNPWSGEIMASNGHLHEKVVSKILQYK